MRTLFIGDVHACTDELEELIDQVQPSRIILVGDLFTKGPHPKKMWQLIKKHRMESTLGNHELNLLRRRHIKLPEAAYKWIEQCPLFIQGREYKVVHAGFNPHGPTLFNDAIYMRYWPNRHSKKFWWNYYTGRKLIIYGHDAMRQLQDHRPYSLGLDTGCVYGGALTGYILEEDRIVQVAAKHAYCPT